VYKPQAPSLSVFHGLWNDLGEYSERKAREKDRGMSKDEALFILQLIGGPKGGGVKSGGSAKGNTTDVYGGYYQRKQQRANEYQKNITNPMTKAQLPNKGKFRFIPGGEVKYNKSLGGYVDKFGNIWRQGPYHGDPKKNFDFEWDKYTKKGKNTLM
jgi:hypothetical protein